jgi:DNA-binding NtrC family response regulator
MPGKSILLVEDHARLRDILTAALESNDFQVISAASADEAISLLEQGLRPDVVFSDIVMAGTINGIELACWVRKNQPACQILLQSGFTQVDTAGFAVLRKPYSSEELLAALT